MDQREVTETTELSATESAQRLLPLLKEYAKKMAALLEHSTEVMAMFVTPETNSTGVVRYTAVAEKTVTPATLEAGRLICLYDALKEPITDLAREASGLIEHSTLEYHLRTELKLRLDELEEHIKFAVVMMPELVTYLSLQKGQATLVRKLIEKNRVKAPF